MAKKNKGKKAKGKKTKAADGLSSTRATADTTRSFWTSADECAHYAALGCHIANVARCRPASKSAPTHNKSRNTAVSPVPTTFACSEYEEMYALAMRQYPWLLGLERFDASEYHPEDLQNIPHIAWGEDERMTLTLTNVTRDTTNICYVTVFEVDVCDAGGNILQSGTASATTSTSTAQSADENDTNATITRERKCTTFIVLIPPQTFVHLCYMAPNQARPSSAGDVPITSWTQVEIESDVQPWSFHPNPDDEHPYLLHFPFVGIGEEALDTATAYQCTQSEDGQLTHFFKGNLHAIDFACPVGTPLYCPANGVVVDVRDHVDKGEDCNKDSSLVSEVSGIAASNMFHWNSIMLRVEDETELQNERRGPLYVEFVHIQTNSCVVRVGDRVRKGQLLCRSGSVGFSPEPHLHLAAYRSRENDAATVRVRFEGVASADGTSTDDETESVAQASFLPVAGGWYNSSGLVK